MMGMGADLYFLEDTDDYDNPLAFDFTSAGAAVMDDLADRGWFDGLYTVDDAVERFMEEIDYWRTEIARVQNAFGVLMQQAMEAPTEENYEMEFQKLQWSLDAKQETLENLEEDLSRLLGRDVAE